MICDLRTMVHQSWYNEQVKRGLSTELNDFEVWLNGLTHNELLFEISWALNEIQR